MEITWFGHSCFRITERSLATVVTDPFDNRSYGFEPLKLKADVVTVSHDSAGHNYLAAVKGDFFPIKGPGEFEIGGVFITGIETNNPGKHTSAETHNTLFVFEYNGVNVAHLGDINRVPTQTEVESLGPVHIALVPVGGGQSLSAVKAAEIISLLEPNIVIPMHFGIQGKDNDLEPLGKFLKEMGLKEVEKMASLKVSGVNSLPEETVIYELDYQAH